MNPTDYLTDEEKSLDVKISGRIQDISVETTNLGAKDSLTDLETRNFEEMMIEFTDLRTQHEKLHRDARSRYIAKAAMNPSQVLSGDQADTDPLGEPESIENRKFHNPWNLDEMRAYAFDSAGQVAELRARALSAIEQMPGTTDKRRKVMTEMVETSDGPKGFISQRILASSPAYLSFWAKRLRYGAEAVLTPEEQGAVLRAMSLTDTEGGFLVPFQLDPAVIITADGSLNQIRQVARVVQATGDVWNGVSSGAVSFSWDAEESEASDDATTFAQPAITIFKAVGFVPISIEALQDEQNVTAEIGRLLAFGKDVHDAAAFALGVGTTEPIGIVTALAGTASVVTSVTTDVFAIADLYATKSGLPARYRPNASWLANDAIYDLIRQFDTAGGAGFWENIGGDRPNELLGKLALEAEDMDGVINATATNNILVFGDFRDYVIADRVGMTVETIPHLFATPNNRPSGQRGFYAYYRVGADSVNDGAFSMLDVT